MLRFYVGAAAVALVGSTPAWAGEEVLYEAAPEWAVASDFDAALAANEPLVLVDTQVRLDHGLETYFSDIAYRIDSPEALTKLGTLKLQWLPDKGDLVVHRLEIVRDGKVIDLLGGGARYTVLRREQALERRTLDGSLTATIAAPGLQVGDVLRFSQSISKRDQALEGEAQVLEDLMTRPVRAGLARIVVSWPEGEEMAFRAGPEVALDAPEARDGFEYLTLDLPLDERKDLPENAPARFTMQPLLQVGSFDSWTDVSRTLAPHFDTAGTVAPGGAIAREVARIERASDKPRERAALALRTVQDEVSYLLNGMNGGNYLPQAPADTWEQRFGDCKAKSLLLLAMLRELGIDSEVVAVRSTEGDMVSQMLPMPGAFDHMIVHAKIDGKDYWLDGTNAGTRLDTMEEVPPFYYALPIRAEGAELMPIEQRWPAVPDRVTRITYDQSAGIDYPMLYDVEIEAHGVMGARMRPQAGETDKDKILAYAGEYLNDLVGEGIVYDAKITYDDARGVAVLDASGILSSPWTFERGRGKFAVGLPSTDFQFEADRARREWRDVPYLVGGPLTYQEDVTVLLPDGGKGIRLTGRTDLDETVAGVRIRRTGELAGGKLVFNDYASKIPVEIPASELAAERAKANRLRSGDPVVRADNSVVRYWQLDEKGAEARLGRLEDAYAAIIANAPDEAWRYTLRGSQRVYHFDYAGALADYDTAIELEPSAAILAERAQLLSEMGRLDAAIADAREAHDLAPTADSGIFLADMLAETGSYDEALDTLDTLDLSGDDRVSILTSRAEIEGEAGRLDDGWAVLEQALDERPGDKDVLNAQCWYKGIFKYALADALSTCDRAVQASDYSATSLDSRAMVHYRLDQPQDALADLGAALASEPGFGNSLYMRGVIRLETGEAADGRADIAQALRISETFPRTYKRYGIEPKVK